MSRQSNKKCIKCLENWRKNHSVKVGNEVIQTEPFPTSRCKMCPTVNKSNDK